MDAGFNDWLKSARGFKPGDTIGTKQQYDTLYKAYLSETAAGPKVTFTNAPTGEPLAIMGNTMQKLGAEAPKVQTMTGNDGVLYAVNPQDRAALAITNAQGQPFVPAPKQPRGMMPEDYMTTPQAQQPQGRGILGGIVDMITGGAKQAPTLPADIASQVQPSAQPTMATNAAAVPSPAAAAQTAPAPQLKTKEEIKQAYRTGQIDQATAVQMLRGM
jgi:hypothetical protein